MVKAERHILLRIAVLTVVSFVYMLWFARFSSPLTGHTGVDYDFFIQGGEFMRRGFLYSGYFDNKGPALYAVNALGLTVCGGKWGIFILEVLSFASVLNLLWSTGRRIAPRKATSTVFGLAVMLIIYISTICGGDSVESWGLLPSSLSLWLYFRHLQGREYAPTLFSTAIIGACFGVILMLRANDCVIIAGICIAVACSLVASHRYRLLLLHSGIFIMSAFVVVGTFCIYFTALGTIDQMFDAVWRFAITYWDSTSSWSLRRMAGNCARMASCFILPFVAYRRDRLQPGLPATFAVSLAASLLTVVSLLRLITLTHYYTVTLPIVFLLFTLAYDILRRYQAIILTVIVLLPWVLWQRADFTDSIERPWRMATEPAYLDSAMYYDSRVRARVVASIPQSELDSVYQLEVPLKHTAIIYHTGHLPTGTVVTGQSRSAEIGGDRWQRYVIREFDRANPRWIIAGEQIDSTILSDKSSRYRLVDSLSAPARFYGIMNFYIYKRTDLP